MLRKNSFMKKISVAKISLLFFVLIISFFNDLSLVKADFFSDVDENHPNYEAVKYLYDKGIVNGREDGYFHPNLNISRVEALKIVYNTNDVMLQENLPNNDSFPDVTNDSWYAPYVFTAKRQNIMQGTENGYFEPDRNISNAETCKVILKTYGVDMELINNSYNSLHSYSDVPLYSWYSGCVGFSYFYGFLSETKQLFYPFKMITRGQFAQFVYNVDKFKRQGSLAKIHPGIPYGEEEESEDIDSEDIKIEENGDDLIPEEYKEKWSKVQKGIASYYGDEFNGKNTASGAVFDNNKMTAAHPLLPFNSKVLVTNLDNGKSVEVEILDCGPFVEGRVIDMTKTAFSFISTPGSGLANVELKVNELGPKKWQDRCYELSQ